MLWFVNLHRISFLILTLTVMGVSKVTLAVTMDTSRLVGEVTAPYLNPTAAPQCALGFGPCVEAMPRGGSPG